MKRILVTGGNGQLGTELKHLAWPEGWEVVAVDIDELDLTDTAAIAAMVAAQPWAAIINGGAYTAVDRAERDVVSAWAINALAPAAFAAACKEHGIPLVHVSTDYVFDGDKTGYWEVNDPTGPINVYGASKLGGELAIATGADRYVIVRTAWVVSAHGNNFVKTMLRLGAERQNMRVVADQMGSPTAAADLAGALATIAIRLATDHETPVGTYHFSNAGSTNWAEFASAIFDGAARRGRGTVAVQPIATADYPTPARRPANSFLSHEAISRDFGIVPRDWREALEDILDELIGKLA